ncbi:MAG: dihydropyrimidinase [Clostridia bacterium]
MKILIKNGIIVTHQESYKADILIEDEVISKIGRLLDEKADRVIDAQNKYVLPGIIDMHTHINHWGGSDKTNDDFFTGSKAAAFGGVTTFIDFAMQKKTEEIDEAIKRRRCEADPDVCIDYSLHANITNVSPKTIAYLPQVIDKGYSSFKLFMTYKKAGFMVEDADFFKILGIVNSNGGLVGIHAENDSICESLTKEFLEAGKTSPYYHAESRPNISEAECISKAILFAEHNNCALYIFHLTTREGVELVKTARRRGVKVMAETCPHYLTLTKELYTREDGQNYIMTPPLREQADIEALWEAVNDDIIAIVSSDHCCYDSSKKLPAKENFTNVSPGIAGTETLLPVLYHFGVNTSRISINKVVELLCYNPARVFGMYPKKGCLQINSDADVVIFNPLKEVLLGQASLHMVTDYSVYDNMKIKGYPETVISRGQIVVENEKFYGHRGWGRFIERGKFTYL